MWRNKVTYSIGRTASNLHEDFGRTGVVANELTYPLMRDQGQFYAGTRNWIQEQTQLWDKRHSSYMGQHWLVMARYEGTSYDGPPLWKKTTHPSEMIEYLEGKTPAHSVFNYYWHPEAFWVAGPFPEERFLQIEEMLENEMLPLEEFLEVLFIYMTKPAQWATVSEEQKEEIKYRWDMLGLQLQSEADPLKELAWEHNRHRALQTRPILKLLPSIGRQTSMGKVLNTPELLGETMQYVTGGLGEDEDNVYY